VSQLELDIPHATYDLTIWCLSCSHSVGLQVTYNQLQTIKTSKLNCTQCGAGRREVKLEVSGVDLGG